MAWVLTLILFAPTLTHQYGRLGLECKSFYCVMINVDTAENPIFPGPMTVYLTIFVISGIFLLSMNVVNYVQVFKQSKKIYIQMQRISTDEAEKFLRNEKKVGKMVALITTSFFLVYVPTTLLNLAVPNSTLAYPLLSITCFFCAILLVVIDPLVYIYSSEKYRMEIQLILHSIRCRLNTLN